jgi:hypothetical protein
MESSPFSAKIRRVYRLVDTQLVVLEDGYEGDVGSGDQLDVEMPEAQSARVEVKDLAWGSAFRADQPPLTLIVTGLEEGREPPVGARIRAV